MMTPGSTLPGRTGRASSVEEPERLAALEHAMQAVALSRVAAGMAHDVKNPLNAMALQIALLGDKIAAGGEDLATACTGNLGSLRNQIVRIDELVRRFADLADPPPGAVVDLGQLAVDVAALFGHEARRRRATLRCEATPGIVTARADPARTARIVLGLAWRALSRAEGGEVVVRAAIDGADATLTFEQSVAPDAELAWMASVAAEAARDMSGALRVEASASGERAQLRFGKESAS